MYWVLSCICCSTTLRKLSAICVGLVLVVCVVLKEIVIWEYSTFFLYSWQLSTQLIVPNLAVAFSCRHFPESNRFKISNLISNDKLALFFIISVFAIPVYTHFILFWCAYTHLKAENTRIIIIDVSMQNGVTRSQPAHARLKFMHAQPEHTSIVQEV